MTATLFLVVDGIPVDLAVEAFEADQLPGFTRPVPMVSVFPSLTNVAVPALLRGVIPVRPPGYEARYYHPPSGTIRGGFADPDSEPGLRVYRPHPEGNLGHFMVYALRGRHAGSQVRWIGSQFERGDGPWLGYLAGTDGVGHFDGRDELATVFGDVCEQVGVALRGFEGRHGFAPRVVLCSDHGFEFGPLRQLDEATVADRLRLAGFREGSTRGTGFVLAPMGVVAGAAAWCSPEVADELAEALVELPGVDLAACRTPDGARVFAVRSGLAAANIRRRPGGWTYEPLTGDPLDLLGRIAPNQLHDDAVVFDATWDHGYPDPLHRIVQGLTELVDHPAPVLFSMAPGWTFGPRATAMAAGLMGGQVGTHGALTRQQSLGFVSTFGDGPDIDELARPALRAGDVFRPFAREVRQALEE